MSNATSFPETQYLTASDLASRYKVTRKTIWTWARNGNLPKPVKLGQACTRWKRADIEAMESQKQAACRAGAA